MRYIIEFIALLSRISMFEDKTQTLHCKLHVLALITCGAIAPTWALIWSVTSVLNADYNGVMISNDTEHTICLRTYIICSMTHLRTNVLCSTKYFGAYVLCLRIYVLMSSGICSMFYDISSDICSMFYHMFWGICSMFYHMF